MHHVRQAGTLQQYAPQQPLMTHLLRDADNLNIEFMHA
jgi:hypothetical protein